jgi:hypothetical protein
MSTDKYLVGIFDDDHDLLHAVTSVRNAGYTIVDAYTPFPVHGLEHVMGLRPTKLHTAGFMFGATGLTVALTMMSFISAFNYKTNYAGKPFWAFPSFIPITFEHTVLYASVGMTISFYYLCNLYPGKKPKIVDHRTTDDKFALTFDINTVKDIETLTTLLKKEGASEVYQKEI